LGVELVAVHWSQIHDVADVQVVDPIVVVLHAKSVPDVDFESFVGLERLNFLQTSELGSFVVRFSLI